MFGFLNYLAGKKNKWRKEKTIFRMNSNSNNSMEMEARELVAQAKQAAHDGELHYSLKLFKKAYSLFPSEKLKRRITKLEVRFFYVIFFKLPAVMQKGKVMVSLLSTKTS